MMMCMKKKGKMKLLMQETNLFNINFEDNILD